MARPSFLGEAPQRISFFASKAERDALKAAATKAGMKQADIIREAIAAWIKRQSRRSPAHDGPGDAGQG